MINKEKLLDCEFTRRKRWLRRLKESSKTDMVLRFQLWLFGLSPKRKKIKERVSDGSM